MLSEEQIEKSLSHIDVTDRVEVYENGKTFECNCGQGIGVRVSIQAVKCEKCGRVCVDRKADSREPSKQETEDNDSNFNVDLTDYM